MNLWIITRDHIEEGAAKGVGSRHWNNDNHPEMFNVHDSNSNLDEAIQKVIKKYGLGIKFKLYDDDGELYYEGSMQVEDFHPMDDFGMPNSGCTELWYSKNNEAFKLL